MTNGNQNKPLKHYTYYVVAGQSQAQQLPIHAFANAAPPPEAVLHPLPKPKEGANGTKPVALFLPRKGA